MKRLTQWAVAALLSLGASVAVIQQLNKDATRSEGYREKRSNRLALLFTTARQPAVATKIAQLYCTTELSDGSIDPGAQACIDAQADFGKSFKVCNASDVHIGYLAKFTATDKQRQVLGILASQTSNVWLIDSPKKYSNVKANLTGRGYKRCPETETP